MAQTHYISGGINCIAETMGYKCGPGGTAIPETREYVIRPIYNLAGMGVCTTIKVLEKVIYQCL